MNGDRLLLTLPPTVGFGPEGISCDPADPALGLTKVSCESIDRSSFAITLDEIQYQAGQFALTVHGMKNPPNYRRSALFSNIFF